jgi:hypothetical protein
VVDEIGILPFRGHTQEIQNIMNTTNTNPEVSTTPSTEVGVPEVTKEIAKLDSHAKMPEIVAKINELVDRANAKRDRGPESTRIMVEADAKRIMLGDLKEASHTKAAEALGLSYGQVYSARKGFTFKTVYKDWERANRKA